MKILKKLIFDGYKKLKLNYLLNSTLNEPSQGSSMISNNSTKKIGSKNNSIECYRRLTVIWNLEDSTYKNVYEKIKYFKWRETVITISTI
jgi:hypothetical protein